MADELPTCPICYNEFDDKEVLPRLVPICGHSICETCLISLLRTLHRSQSFVCPLDKKQMSIPKKDINLFPVNHTLMRMGPKIKNCEEHNKPLELLCLTDNTWICYHCGILGSHQGHQFQSMKEIAEKRKEAADKKKKMIQGIHRKILDYEHDIGRVIGMRRTAIVNSIESVFQGFVNKLMWKKAEIIKEAERHFERYHSSALVGDGQQNGVEEDLFALKLTLEEMLQIYEPDGQNGGPMDIRQEQIDFVGTKVDSFEFGQKLNELDQSLQQLNFFFDKNFNEAIQRVGYVDAIHRPPVTQEKRIFTENSSRQNPRINDYEEEKIDSNSRQNGLGIQPLHRFPKKANPFLEKLSMRFPGSNFNQNQNGIEREPQSFRDLVPEEDNFFILEDHSSHVLHLFSKTVQILPSNAKPLKNLFSMEPSQLETLHRVKIDLSTTPFDVNIIEQLSFFISHLTSATSLEINFSRSGLADLMLQDLSPAFTRINEVIEDFDLNLEETRITDSGLISFLNNNVQAMRNLRRLKLNVAQTQIFDSTMRTLIQKVLPKINEVESLALNFTGTRVTDEGMKELVDLSPYNLRKLTRLEMKYANTFMNDRGALYIVDLVKRLEGLSHLALSLHGTQISRTLKSRLPDLLITHNLTVDLHL